MFYNYFLEMTKKTPSRKPSRKVRLILYPIIGTLFVFVLGALLMLANGFWPEMSEGKLAFKKTGMIILAARPLDASIYVNGKYKEKTSFYLLPNKLNNLLPGDYKIRIEKKGYRTWEKTIKVEPGLVAWANYILMFADKLDIQQVKDFSGTPAATSDNGRYLLYTGTKEGKFFSTSQEANGLSTRSFWPKDSSTLPDWLKSPTITAASFSQNSDKVLYTIKNGEVTEYVVAEANGSDVKLVILNEQFKVAPVRASWNPYDNEGLFVTVAEKLYHAKITASTLGNAIATNVVSYKYEANRQLYFAVRMASGNVQIEKSNLDGNNKVIILDSIVPAAGYQFTHTSQGDMLAVRSADTGDLLLVYPANGENNVVLRLGKSYKDIAWSKNGLKLLYYDGTTIYRYDSEKKKESHFASLGAITSVRWYYDDCHFLVNGDDGLRISEYDGGNPLALSFSPQKIVALDTQNYSLVYGETKDSAVEYFRFTSQY